MGMRIHETRECDRPIAIDDKLCLTFMLFPILFTNTGDSSRIINKNIDRVAISQSHW